jgi:hypothetical protein
MCATVVRRRQRHAPAAVPVAGALDPRIVKDPRFHFRERLRSC